MLTSRIEMSTGSTRTGDDSKSNTEPEGYANLQYAAKCANAELFTEAIRG